MRLQVKSSTYLKGLNSFELVPYPASVKINIYIVEKDPVSPSAYIWLSNDLNCPVKQGGNVKSRFAA